ncbi:MAG TPA: bifunctional DNA primase/polymerase [Gemmataceae bacterium]|nr:bifunctional DNA primase/polymerase [Gemmataceae bacterium]
MEHSPESVNESMIQAALEYRKLGFRPIPLSPGTKAACVKWKAFQARPPTEGEIEAWFGSGVSNIALLTGNGVVVVDVDDPGLLDEVLERCGTTPMMTRTPSGGVHCWFRMRAGVHYGNAVKIKGRAVDLRCEGAYAVSPWSRNAEGVPYRWVGPVLPVEELPLLRVSWLREKKARPVVTQVDVGDNLDAMARRARAYLATIEGAVSGNYGHNRTFRVACVLMHKFRLSIEQAMSLFLEWNETCDPPWEEKDLIRKLQEALKHGKPG